MKLLLLVEDAKFMKNDLEKIIKKNYPDVMIKHFAHGESILAYYKELCEKNQKVDAIVLDHTMSVLEGAEACKQILRINPGVPIIAFTGSLRTTTNFLELGVKIHIHKPIFEQQVLQTLDIYLKM